MTEDENSRGVTHVLMVVDMSGSMNRLADDVRGGFNGYVADLRDRTGDAVRVTAVTFDDRYLPLCTDAALDAVPALDTGNYVPCGVTALLDAVGKTILDFECRVRLGEHDRAICVVQTDGRENASRTFTWEAIRDLIKSREASGRWMFVYIGTGLDSWDQAQRMGYGRNTYMHTQATAQGTAATYSGLVGTTVFYSGGAGPDESMKPLRDEAGK